MGMHIMFESCRMSSGSGTIGDFVVGIFNASKCYILRHYTNFSVNGKYSAKLQQRIINSIAERDVSNCLLPLKSWSGPGNLLQI